jgi:hypothetical protein
LGSINALEEAPVGRVRRVAREHVEDEALFDRLSHAVQVERLELAIGALRAKDTKRRHAANLFSVIRQVRYSERTEHSLDIHHGE